MNEETSQPAVSRPNHQLITGSHKIKEPINPSKSYLVCNKYVYVCFSEGHYKTGILPM